MIPLRARATRSDTLLPCTTRFRSTSLRWARRRNITFKFDSAHPIGAAHHQKIVVIDDALAFCGGIDMTADRWDTSAHLDDDPRRRRPSGRFYGAWHDATVALDKIRQAAGREIEWSSVSIQGVSVLIKK